MDTVHSSRDSRKTLLTFCFTREKLFLAFLINRCTKGAVRHFGHLEKRLDTYGFLSLFEYTLSGRGSEFGGPEALKSFGEYTFKALQLRCIAPGEVHLTPKLIRYYR